MESIKIRGHHLEHLAEIYQKGMDGLIPGLIELEYIDNPNHPFVYSVKQKVDEIFNNRLKVSVVVGEADFICLDCNCPKEESCVGVHPEKSRYYMRAWYFDPGGLKSERDLCVIKRMGVEARDYDADEFRKILGLELEH